MTFQRNDRVLINGGVLATIESYDEAGGSVVYRIDLPGGGTDTHTARIANTDIAPLASLDTALAEAETETKPSKK